MARSGHSGSVHSQSARREAEGSSALTLRGGSRCRALVARGALRPASFHPPPMPGRLRCPFNSQKLLCLSQKRRRNKESTIFCSFLLKVSFEHKEKKNSFYQKPWGSIDKFKKGYRKTLIRCTSHFDYFIFS